MRKQILTFIAAYFYYSGLVKLARWLHQRAGQRLIILNYHRATGGDLRSQMLYLRRHYRILHLEEALEELYSPSKQENAKRDRRTSLVLTFDDGYHDNYTHGFALARELQVPITIFLIPGYIESGEYFWWLEGKRLVQRAQVNEVTIDGCTYCLERLEERDLLAQTLDGRLRYASSVAEREALLATFREALAVPSHVLVEEERTRPLTWAEVHKMAESGWVSFGAHTMHHPILAYLKDPQEVQHEVEQCRDLLEQQLGHPVRTFAYPVGQLKHIGDRVLHAVQQVGYDWSLTTRYGCNTPRSAPYLLRRIEVDVNQHWLVMAAETACLWGIFARLRWIPLLRKHLRGKD
jgi:peptidoglycan/xylan/chitin deacetylase (PgdA/CDA1 family)